MMESWWSPHFGPLELVCLLTTVGTALVVLKPLAQEQGRKDRRNLLRAKRAGWFVIFLAFALPGLTVLPVAMFLWERHVPVPWKTLIWSMFLPTFTIQLAAGLGLCLIASRLEDQCD